MIESVLRIFQNSSLWEVTTLIVVIYFMCRPSLLRTVTRLKVGDMEIELNSLKQKVAQGEEQINELQAELESDRRLFSDLLENVDANAPLKDLAETRKSIKAAARNLDDLEGLRGFLSASDVSPAEMFAAAITIRERRPVALAPDLIALLTKLAASDDLGGYRLNTVWTLTSALHLMLVAAVRDKVTPFPAAALLLQASRMLDALEQHPRVQADRPDNPMKGIRGPIKHCRTWIQKSLLVADSNQ